VRLGSGAGLGATASTGRHLADQRPWQYDPDPEHASEIEVCFSADGPEQTTVTLEHRHLERLVDGQALRDGITGGGGWPSLLELFAKAATNQT
jgi:hypothetical protein